MTLKVQSPLPPELEQVAEQVVDAVFRVHTELGPGLLESIYEKCLAWELASRGLKVSRQLVLPIVYRGHRIDDGLRLDLVVQDQIVVEIKAVHQMEPLFKAQVITYLRLSGRRLGFLVNFNTVLIRDGIERVII